MLLNLTLPEGYLRNLTMTFDFDNNVVGAVSSVVIGVGSSISGILLNTNTRSRQLVLFLGNVTNLGDNVLDSNDILQLNVSWHVLETTRQRSSTISFSLVSDFATTISGSYLYNITRPVLQSRVSWLAPNASANAGDTILIKLDLFHAATSISPTFNQIYQLIFPSQLVNLMLVNSSSMISQIDELRFSLPILTVGDNATIFFTVKIQNFTVPATVLSFSYFAFYDTVPWGVVVSNY